MHCGSSHVDTPPIWSSGFGHVVRQWSSSWNEVIMMQSTRSITSSAMLARQELAVLSSVAWYSGTWHVSKTGGFKTAGQWMLLEYMSYSASVLLTQPHCQVLVWQSLWLLQESCCNTSARQKDLCGSKQVSIPLLELLWVFSRLCWRMLLVLSHVTLNHQAIKR